MTTNLTHYPISNRTRSTIIYVSLPLRASTKGANWYTLAKSSAKTMSDMAPSDALECT